MVQWLGLWAYTVGGMGSTPGQGTKILHTLQCGQKIKIKVGDAHIKATKKKNKPRDTNRSLGTPCQWTGLKVESAGSWGLWSLPGLDISPELLGFSRERSPCPSWRGCQAPGGAEVAHCRPPVEFLSTLLISSPFAKLGECSNVTHVQQDVFPLEEQSNAKYSIKQKKEK